MPAYLFDGRAICPDDAEFGEALAAAHAGHHRPLCLCLAHGAEMYVARLGAGFILKRMPCTGAQHAPDCPSYEPPLEWSGLGQVMGSAIVEDPASGITSLKLGFAMAKTGARSSDCGAASGGASVADDGGRLGLRGLLHYLWDQSELTRWRPGFAGRRSWATVRRYLLLAAEGKIARGRALQDRLYIPEVFSVEHRDEINARRLGQWMHAMQPTKRQGQHERGRRPLMLLIGEVKEIVPARHGFKAVIKHVPDQAFALDDQLYRRVRKRFERELSLWATADSVHMVMIATFGLSGSGVPTIDTLSLMPVTGQWLPIEDLAERQLLERLVRDGRTFVKSLRYGLPDGQALASAILTDVDGPPVALCIARLGQDEPQMAAEIERRAKDGGCSAWIWRVGDGGDAFIPPRKLGPEGINRCGALTAGAAPEQQAKTGFSAGY